MIEIRNEELRLSELFIKYATNEDVLALENICRKVKEQRENGLKQKQLSDGLNEVKKTCANNIRTTEQS